jgi:hypothetical protein
MGCRPFTWIGGETYWGVFFCAFVGYTGMVWIDTIIQNLMVKEGRKDSKYGA